VRKRALGRTGLKVSEIGFGGWAIGGNEFGNSYGTTSDEESKAALRRALELGVTLLETADVYGHGHSEALIGEVLAEWDGPRPVVVTKGGVNFYRNDGTMDQDWTPLGVTNAVEMSRSRLRCDALDVFLLMSPPVQELGRFRVWETLEALQRGGKVKHWGVSVAGPEDGVWLLENGVPVDVIEVSYSIFFQGAVVDLLPLARGQKVGILAREPLANGFLTGKYTGASEFEPGDIRAQLPPEYAHAMAETAEQLRFLEQTDRTLAQAALRFALDQQGIASVVAGAKTAAQVEENVAAAMGKPLLPDELNRIAEVFSE
jgi:aryl-alcohol dehydrogenase-like predicted oxidoreductase